MRRGERGQRLVSRSILAIAIGMSDAIQHLAERACGSWWPPPAQCVIQDVGLPRVASAADCRTTPLATSISIFGGLIFKISFSTDRVSSPSIGTWRCAATEPSENLNGGLGTRN